MRVDQLRGTAGTGQGGGHGQVGGYHLEGLVGVGQQLPGPVRDRVGPVGALAVHGQIDQRGQLAGQVGDVHAGPPYTSGGYSLVSIATRSWPVTG